MTPPAFFQPPPDPWPEQAQGGEPPPWTGRPRGRPLGAVVSDLVLARSEAATVSVAYIDAYPEGFELEISATTSIAYHDLPREANDLGPDVFGRHWPLAGGRSDVLPPQLLRVGVQFADGRTATNIGGHDLPAEGPTLWSLAGGGRGRTGHGAEGGSRFHQGYWISPLPPPGAVALVCEWPATGIPVARRELDAELFREGADRARAMFTDGSRVRGDGRDWRLGTDADVAWLRDGTRPGPTIQYALPLAFDAYCTLELPEGHEDGELRRHEQAVIELLTEQTHDQPWWLGYLDTGASGVVFPYAPRLKLYQGYGYVLVEAGPEQALSWRETGFNWALPNLIFPADRSWLVSTMWDDEWTCIGGPEQLVSRLLDHTMLGPRARRIDPAENPTPPGHESR